ncbi:MAG: YbhN family protein [Anaerolineae bacterium]
MALTEGPSRLADLAPPAAGRRALLLPLLGVATLLLLIRWGGAEEARALLERARGELVVGALAAESVRYIGTGLLMRQVLGFVGHRIALWPTVAVILAGAALNRLIVAGGAGGLYLRYRYLDLRKVPLGAISSMLLIQTLVTAVILLLTFLLGLLALAALRGLTGEEIAVSGAVALGVIAVFAVTARLYPRPRRVQALLLTVAGTVAGWVGRLTRIDLYDEEGLKNALRRLYRSVSVARHNRRALLLAFGFAASALLADILALYLVFRALGTAIHPGILTVGYAISNYLSNLAFLPDGLVVTEASLAGAYASLAVAPAAAATAVLVFRLISFWLPIPIGAVAFWMLRRRAHL